MLVEFHQDSRLIILALDILTHIEEEIGSHARPHILEFFLILTIKLLGRAVSVDVSFVHFVKVILFVFKALVSSEDGLLMIVLGLEISDVLGYSVEIEGGLHFLAKVQLEEVLLDRFEETVVDLLLLS